MEIQDTRTLSPAAQQALRERVVHAVEVEGLRIAAAARAAGVNRSSASGGVHAFRRRGAPALAAKPRGRKPRPLLPADQRSGLLPALRDKTPDQVRLAEALVTGEAVGD